VIIVNETFAKTHFPGEDAIGKRIQPGISTFDNEKAPMREIVGVVGDVRNRGLDTPARPAFYDPITQVPFPQMSVVVKTTGDPHSLIPTITREVTQFDKELPVFSVKTMDEYLASSVAAPRFNTTLLSIFAGVALVLTIIGLYGVMSYSVAQRTNEIGIRLALGAQTGNVVSLVVAQGLRLVLLGLAIGLAGAFAASRIVKSLLFGVTTKDPLTFALAAGLLGAVGLLACYLPARRATKVDPIEALRCE
jgi:putative ABC transport system permease protein